MTPSNAAKGFWANLSEPMFLPDIGTYFNQDMAQAKQMVDALLQAGVKTIKGEILQNADICLDASQSGNERYWGQVSGEFVEENYRALIERKVVPLSAYRELMEYASYKGASWVMSVYDFEGADFAKQMGCVAIKIASSNITHQPLIEYVAKLGVPMLFDTGHTTMEEAARAINWAQDQGAFDLLIEHSPKAPPNPVEQQNLRYMLTLGHAMGLPYGLSDHYAGEEMLYAATAIGALVLEKGVCPNDMPDEQDGGQALPIGQVAEVVSKIRNIALGLGDGQRHLPRQRVKYASRMGLVAARDLQVGDKVDLGNVRFAFPALGIRAEYWSEVEGQVLNRPLSAGEVIGWRDIVFRET